MTVATLAHEIRTPLATLRVTLDVLEDVLPRRPTEAAQLVARLQRSVAWIDAVVENLTVSAAMETGRAPDGAATASITECLQQTLNQLQPFLDQRRQRVQASCRPDLPRVRITPPSLRQVLLNLLGNASKYSPEGETIRISGGVEPGRVRVTISDRGPGIAPPDRERIFEAFVRGPAPQRGTAGLGLGLHVVKTLLTAHGGRAGVDTAEGGGSSFWFELASADAAPPVGSERGLRYRTIGRGRYAASAR